MVRLGGREGSDRILPTPHGHVGAHVESEAQCFPAMRARVPGLLAWIGESAIARPQRIANVDGKTVSLTMTLVPGTISMTEHDGIPGQITISKFVSQDGERFNTWSLASEGWVEIRPTAPQPIEQLLRSFNQVLSLLGLLAGPCMHFDAIELTLADDRSAGLLFSPSRHRVCDVSRQWGVPDSVRFDSGQVARAHRRLVGLYAPNQDGQRLV